MWSPEPRISGRSLRKLLYQSMTRLCMKSLANKESHESAHTFGAIHDCTSSSCGSDSTQCCPLSSDTCDADGQYLMDPVSRPGMTRFSPCTIGNVCSRLGSGQVDGGCLVDSRTGNTTASSEQCGNGIVEDGEACDCGNGACTEQETRCCDSVTCQLRTGDECDQTNDLNPESTGDNGNTQQGNWVQDHLPLVIGLSAGIGGTLLLLIFGCLICSCRRSRREPVVKAKPVAIPSPPRYTPPPQYA